MPEGLGEEICAEGILLILIGFLRRYFGRFGSRKKRENVRGKIATLQKPLQNDFPALCAGKIINIHIYYSISINNNHGMLKKMRQRCHIIEIENGIKSSPRTLRRLY